MRYRVSTVALLLACLVTFASASFARKSDEVNEMRKQAEASLLVSGTIVVDPEGKVRSYELTRKDSLPAAVVELMADSVPNWRFEPVVVDGQAVSARSDMSLLVIAKQVADDGYEVRIGGASFGDTSSKPETRIRGKRMTPPEYPFDAYSVGASGTAYVVAKVGRNGRAQDMMIEQVNLRVVGTEKEMARLRDVLGTAALGAAKRWIFIPPTEGPDAADEFWSVRVPVVFDVDGKRGQDGKWQAYVPGPRQPVLWESDREDAFSPDALPGGAVHLAGSGLKLLTPLSG